MDVGIAAAGEEDGVRTGARAKRYSGEQECLIGRKLLKQRRRLEGSRPASPEGQARDRGIDRTEARRGQLIEVRVVLITQRGRETEPFDPGNIIAARNDGEKELPVSEPAAPGDIESCRGAGIDFPREIETIVAKPRTDREPCSPAGKREQRTLGADLSRSEFVAKTAGRYGCYGCYRALGDVCPEMGSIAPEHAKRGRHPVRAELDLE